MLLLLALGVPATPDKGDKENPPVPLVRVIPGWVQMRSGHTLKGILLLGGFVSAVTGAVILNHQGNQSYASYLASRDAARVVALRRETERHFHGRNWFLAGAAAVLVTHFLDLEFAKKKHAQITGDLDPGGFRLGCRIDF